MAGGTKTSMLTKLSSAKEPPCEITHGLKTYLSNQPKEKLSSAKAPHLDSAKALSSQKVVSPYPDGSFRIGATYDEGDLSDAPTEG
jgi:hypothetical protein